jgi:DNA-binding response OmpR family regulator
MNTDTILIVEDDPAIARLLEVYLAERGYNILLATRGEDAIEICQRESVDLILLDIRLPDITGYDVGSTLRSIPQTQNIPIIVLTAFTERKNKMDAYHMGAEVFLSKPFDIEEVHQVVRNNLESARRQAQYNPVTGLPTGSMVGERLRNLLTSEGWTLALIRINGFEGFTQFYGSVVGENVLKFTALQLTDVVREYGDSSDFVGQMVAGPSFVIISTPSRIQSIAEDLISRFDKGIKLHYDYRDRTRGHLEVIDATGEPRQHPLMSLSIGVLLSSDGPFRDIRELTQIAEQILPPVQPVQGEERRSAIGRLHS